MKDKEKYLSTGFLIKKFKKSRSFDKMIQILKELYIEAEAPGIHEWKSKYLNTLDLRPNVYEIDDCFIDILNDNKVIENFQNFTGVDNLMLAHIQIRKSSKGPSYMDWHRDCYFVDGHIKGNFPPTHKLIFYPRFNNSSEKKLKLLKASNNCMLSTQTSEIMLAPGFSQFDQQLMNFLEVVTYSSSEDEYLLLDTSCLHGVIPDEIDEGSIRIIYSFVTKAQFNEKFADQTLHTKLNEKYISLQNKREE